MNLSCTVVHYADLNSSFVFKLRTVGCAISFFIYIYFNGASMKYFIAKLWFFNTNFQTSFQDVVNYRI